jgi:hypothetical protein
MNTTTIPTVTTAPIMAIDLGKYKSVAGVSPEGRNRVIRRDVCQRPVMSVRIGAIPSDLPVSLEDIRT